MTYYLVLFFTISITTGLIMHELYC